jgi:hypothetical protein
MQARVAAARLLAALAPPAVLLLVGALVNSDAAAGLCNASAVIYLIVGLIETVLARSYAEPASDAADSPAPPDISDGIMSLIAYTGMSTPTVARAAASDKSESVLSGWLDVIAAKLGAVVDHSCGVMVVREAFALSSEDLVPYCQVEFRGGSPQCTLPTGSHIPVSTGVETGIAEYSGARSLYLTSIDTGDNRYWLCITFASPFVHHGLDALCDAMTGPVGVALAANKVYGGARRSSLPPIRPELLPTPQSPSAQERSS